MATAIRVYRADTGSCNGCDIEVLASLDPKYGLGELNVSVAEHPEEANVLLVTGLVTKKTAPELKKIYEKIQEPRLVIAYGQCAVGMDVFYDSYNAVGAVDEVIPVNFYLPGCPPSPRATLYGVTAALGVTGFKEGEAIWNVPEAFRGKVEVDEEACIGCGGCAEVCPPAAIDIEEKQDNKILRFWHSKCIRCGSCKDICPSEAITMSDDYRLVTGDRQKLFSEITKDLQRCAGCGQELVNDQVISFALEAVADHVREKHGPLRKTNPETWKKIASVYAELRKKCKEDFGLFCPACRKTLDKTKAEKSALLSVNREEYSVKANTS